MNRGFLDAKTPVSSEDVLTMIRKDGFDLVVMDKRLISLRGTEKTAPDRLVHL